MQLICPTCGEQIKAENVNVQDMVAVCSACDSVFKFSLAEPKTKRRKVSQPPQLALQDGDTLNMDFRTNFRLDQNEAFLTTLFISITLSFATVLMFSKAFDGEWTGFLQFIIAAITASLYYIMATIVYNRTHIEMDEESIQVSRKPLPSLFNQTRDIKLSGVVSIYSEETSKSKKEGFDTPRYHVWAVLADGNRKVIVTDVIDDYAVFIAQRLTERLDSETDVAVSRLTDNVQIDDDYYVDKTDPPQSMNQ